MKKTIAVLLVGMILLISANSVLAYDRFCDSCGVIVDGYDECYRRTSATYNCPYLTVPIEEEVVIGCTGGFWWCFTDWCCIYGHGTWTTNDHLHGSFGHFSNCLLEDGVHCIY